MLACPLAPEGAQDVGTPLPLPPNARLSVHMNRLEVDHIAVTRPDGTTQMVAGTFAVERKNNTGAFAKILGTEPTHTGVDLPDGTYRVTSMAPNAPTQVTTVTFP